MEWPIGVSRYVIARPAASSLAAPLDADHWIIGAVTDRDTQARTVEVELEALDGRQEA